MDKKMTIKMAFSGLVGLTIGLGIYFASELNVANLNLTNFNVSVETNCNPDSRSPASEAGTCSPKHDSPSVLNQMGNVLRHLFASKPNTSKPQAEMMGPPTPKDGVVFKCSPTELAEIENGLNKYMDSLKVDKKLIKIEGKDGTLRYSLNTPNHDQSTLDFHKRKEFGIQDEVITLPAADGKTRQVTTVSQKEILFGLFQHGRTTTYEGDECRSEALIENIGIRQNTSAWTEKICWGFPDGKKSEWNPKYWGDSPKPIRGTVYEAIHDAFVNPNLYSMGCYSATKMVMIHGVLDYYSRINPNPAKVKAITQELMVDEAPLRDPEPGAAWDFLESTKRKGKTELARPGKVLCSQKEVAPLNFVPGDWIYIQNTDSTIVDESGKPKLGNDGKPIHIGSNDKSGYEGSNAVYMGRDRFDDYYCETAGRKKSDNFYTHRQKGGEVEGWQHGIFIANRDNPLSLTDAKYQQLKEGNLKNVMQPHHRIVHCD